MADNLSVRDGAGDTQTLAAKDVAGVKVPRHNIVDESNNVVAVATSAKQDSQIAALGATNDAEATADGSIVAVLKRLRTLLGNAATSAKQDALAALIGEVQASPTSNTLLDRLKALLTGIVLAAGSNVIGKVGLQVGGSDVSSSNPVPAGNAQVTTTTAVISNAASLSSGVDLGTARLARIVMPASWTTANLTFQTSPDNAVWNDLYDSYGTEYAVVAAASRSIIVPLVDFIGVRYLKVRSGTSAAAVAQGGDRTLTLVLVP